MDQCKDCGKSIEDFGDHLRAILGCCPECAFAGGLEGAALAYPGLEPMSFYAGWSVLFTTAAQRDGWPIPKIMGRIAALGLLCAPAAGEG